MSDAAAYDLLLQLLRRVPEEDRSELPAIEAFVREAGLLEASEPLVGGMTETWLGGPSKGVVITPRRIFRYHGPRTSLEIELDRVSGLSMRRMWYPRNPGAIGALGSIEIVRMRFECADSRTVRLKLQGWTAEMRTILDPLLAHHGERTRILRALPGL